MMGENSNRSEAERLLGIAEKLLESQDLKGSKEFAILAQETEPLLEGTDQILAVIDVLLSSSEENRLKNNPNWYKILQIEDPTIDDNDLIKKQYRRLALLLHPDKNHLPFANQAFKSVLDAWEVLSNASKKSQFDRDLNVIFTKVDLNKKKKRVSIEEQMATFWTACPYCYSLHEYHRVYQEYCIRCQNCHRAFHAASISQLPPLVPGGKDEYYCCWGFFPMGFVGGEADVTKFPNWMPPVFASDPVNGDIQANGNGPNNGNVVNGGGFVTPVVAPSSSHSVQIGFDSDGVMVKKRGRPKKNQI